MSAPTASTPMEFTGERFVPSLTGPLRYEHLHRYALARELVAGKDVLDIACGEGYGAILMAGAARTVIGVDIDPATIEHAQSAYGDRNNVRFAIGACDAIPLADASVDVVVSFETIEHHDQHDAMLREIWRVLRPGGLLILSSPNRATYAYADDPEAHNPYHVKELDRTELETLLRTHFRHVVLYGQKVVTGSFVFDLAESGVDPLVPFVEDDAGIAAVGFRLDNPMYYVAVCSDNREALRALSGAASFYTNYRDDYLGTLKTDIRQCHKFIRELQDHRNAALLQLQQQEAQMQEIRILFECEVEQLRARIRGMEASPFWKLRVRVCGLRNRLGLGSG